MFARSKLAVVALFGAGLLAACGSGTTRKPGNPSNEWFKTEVLSPSAPVLVEFGAEWCGPCRSLEPSLDKLAAAYEGKLKVVKVDVDDHPDVSDHFGITGIPHLMIFKDGKIVAEEAGAMPYDDLEAWIKDQLN